MVTQARPPRKATNSAASSQRPSTSSASASTSKRQVIDFDDDDDEEDGLGAEEEDDLDQMPPPLAAPRASSSRNGRDTPAASTSSQAGQSRTQSTLVGDDGDGEEVHGGRGGTQGPSPTPAGPTPTIQAHEEREEDCIRILLATDNHIGYNERDPVRGNDSINTFKEILELAKEKQVDMVLLAGDLFHENKPSRASMYQTLALLREHCMNSNPISLEIVSDVGVGIQTAYNFPPINYEDENFNIGLPVFSIHGNHDDPQGAGPEGALCALDLLSASGLINYFGRQELPGQASTDEEARESGMQVKPILLKKGETKLAMFGVGNIRDERFHSEMRKNRISMFRPAEDPDSWFNLLLIHQNRVSRGPKTHVPDNSFGEEVDLIVWGHEHDCRIDPEPVTGKAYYITQPGSSVATSLAKGESEPKHVALLKIQGKNFQLDKIRLKTVRPFIFQDISLADAEEIEGVDLENKQKVNKYLKAKVNELIDQANEEWDELYPDVNERPPRLLPLIRLRVEYVQHEIGNPQRFGQDFTNKVANPRDIVQFYRKKTVARGQKVTIDVPEGMEEAGQTFAVNGEVREKIKVETLVRQYLEAQTLSVLHENELGSAVNSYVEKDDRHAINTFIEKTLDKQRKNIQQQQADEQKEKGEDTDQEIEDNMRNTKEQLKSAWEEKNAKNGKGKKKGATPSDEEEEEEDAGSDFDRMSLDSDASRAKGKGKAATNGKGKASASTAKGGKGKKKELFQSDSDNDSEAASSDRPAPKKKAPAARKTTTTAKKPAATATRSKKTPAPTQSQLSFAPSRSTSRATPAASSAKKKKQVESDSEEDSDVAIVLDEDDSEDEPPKRKKPPVRKR